MSLPRPTKRSRSGCMTCRSRKKKCNEAKPTCEACLRLKLDCVWPTAPSSTPSETTNTSNKSPSADKVSRPNKRKRSSSITTTGSTKSKRTTTTKTKDPNPGNSIATMHIGVVQGNNSLLSTDPIPSYTVPSLGPADSSVVSIAKIRESPDTGKHYSSDEGNTRRQSTSMATTTSLNSTTHKKSNYYLKKIAMQEDCVENESTASTSATVSPVVSPSAPIYPPQLTTIPPLPLEAFIDLNPSFDYQDGNKE